MGTKQVRMTDRKGCSYCLKYPETELETHESKFSCSYVSSNLFTYALYILHYSTRSVLLLLGRYAAIDY